MALAPGSIGMILATGYLSECWVDFLFHGDSVQISVMGTCQIKISNYSGPCCNKCDELATREMNCERAYSNTRVYIIVVSAGFTEISGL